MRICRLIVSACLAVWGGMSWGQAAGNVKEGSNPARTTIGESLGTIEKRDLLRVRILGLKPPPTIAEKWARVDEDGAASLPYLGARKLAGLTTAQAEAELVKAYREAKVIADAQVDVRRIEAGSRVKGATVGKLAKGDLVAITVEDMAGPGLSAEFRSHVGADGEVPVPLLGAVKLEGMTDAQAERAIAKEFEKRGIMRDGVVGVRVVEAAEQSKLKPGPVAKGDLLWLEIYELAGPGVATRYHARVGPDGAIGVPLIGAVPVDGLSEAKVVEAINRQFRERRLIQNGITSVYRVESADQATVKLGPVAPGDVLRVGIVEVSGPGVETIKTVKVDEKGQIALPMVTAIPIGGLTEVAAGEAIAKAYRENHVVAHAQVTVLKINPDAPLPEDELRPATPEALPRQPARQARTPAPQR